MNLRALTAVVLLALAFQGPVVAYTATLGALAGAPAGHGTSGMAALSDSDCGECCSNASGPCCAVTCAFSAGAAPPTDATLPIQPAHLEAIPAPRAVQYVGHDPTRLLRPPIV